MKVIKCPILSFDKQLSCWVRLKSVPRSVLIVPDAIPPGQCYAFQKEFTYFQLISDGVLEINSNFREEFHLDELRNKVGLFRKGTNIILSFPHLPTQCFQNIRSIVIKDLPATITFKDILNGLRADVIRDFTPEDLL